MKRSGFSGLVVIVSMILLPIASIVHAENAQSRIENGTQHPASDFPTVVLIGDAAQTFSCSGTLIGPRHVLTAGHCASSPEIGGVLADTNGRVTVGTQVIKTSKIYINPSYSPILVGQPGIIDAAIYELETPITGVTYSTLKRDAPKIGDAVMIVGYGKLGTGQAGISNKLPAPGQIYSGTNVIDSIDTTTISWTFDPGTSGIAPGDSGGPAFIGTDVAGIHSLFRSSSLRLGGFGTVNQDTRVDVIVPWIDSILSGSTSNLPPTITSNANVDRSSAQVGQPIQFNVGATDPDPGQNLLYVWDFGDGTAATGATTVHGYVFPGSYTAVVTVSDGISTVQSSVNVTISDNPSTTLSVKKMQLITSFIQSFADSFSIQGSLSPMPDFSAGPITINIGGAMSTYMVSGNGRGVSIDGTIIFNLRNSTFTAVAKKEDFGRFWTKYGMVNNTVTNQPIMMPVSVSAAGRIYFLNVNQSYTGRKGLTGRTK